jgi:diguanylate cyclase (GGDEF)-like protein/PAS domain S-box-containing protein
MDRLPLLAVCSDEIAADCHLPICNVRLGVACPSTNSPYAASRPHARPDRDHPEGHRSIADDLLRDLRIHQCELPMEKRRAGKAAAPPRLSDAWASLILDTVPQAMLVVDEHGVVIRANAGAHTVFGYSEGGLPGLAVEALMPEPLRTAHAAHRARFFANPGFRAMGEGREVLGRRADGSVFPAEIGIGTMRMDKQAFAVVSIVDISKRRRAEDELRIAAIAFESQSGMIVTDALGTILRVNPGFTRLTGYSAEEAVGKTPRLLSSGRHPPEFYRQMWATIIEKGQWQGQIWNRHKDGRIFSEWLTITAVIGANGKASHYVSTFSEITESAEAEARIHRLAYYDALTQLPNRRLLHDRIGQALIAISRNGLHGAILLVDLDGFMAMNDRHGHDSGDQLLIEVTRRLLLTVRDSDTVSRLVGDQFVVVLEELSSEAEEAATLAKQVGEKLGAAIRQPCRINGDDIRCTASIGVSLFHTQDTVDQLLKHANLAMYQAKAAGRDALRFFDPEMQARIDDRSALIADLHQALTNRQLQLHFQPQFDAGGRVIGAETLLCWTHPQRGSIAPDIFIPLAEESGLIMSIGYWVLETACAQLKAWATNANACELMLAVNVSPRQFADPDFAHQVRSVLAASGANPERLKIELTESLALDNIEDTIEKMRLLKALGITFSMDDFGTGYSSLAYLTQLPLDELKIDRSFVLNLPDNATDGIIARTIITMGRSLALKVVAEGVETERQREFLERHGCHAYQGYLYSKPLPQGRFEEFLAASAA